MLQISTLIKHTHFLKRLQYSFKNICDIIDINNTLFKHTHIWFRKHRPDMDMSNNYVSLCCFSWLCWLVCFVVHFNYFIIKIMFQRMWRDDYLLYCSVRSIIRSDIQLSVIWYIAYVDWNRITMKNVYVILTPNLQVLRYSHISDQSKKLITQFEVHTTGLKRLSAQGGHTRKSIKFTLLGSQHQCE